jgi:hypothetical protein
MIVQPLMIALSEDEANALTDEVLAILRLSRYLSPRAHIEKAMTAYPMLWALSQELKSWERREKERN